MKKFLIFSILCIFLCGQAFANVWSAQDKKDFYDSFIASFFISFQQGILTQAQGIKEQSVYMYVSTLRGRLNRTELENATWGCISKYSPESLATGKDAEKVYDECFGKWMESFIYEKNVDALKILVREQ